VTVILFIAVIVLGGLVSQLSGRTRVLERRLAELQDHLLTLHQRLRAIEPASRQAEPEIAAAPEPAEPPADIQSTADAEPLAAMPAPAPAIVAPPAAPFAPAPAEPGDEPAPATAPATETREPVRIGFEAIVGGKLPIWIGGAALVLSAFFLVRYSIENGLLGPAARTIIAGLFALLLLAASEAARRLAATRDDPRIGQALAGAGIASLYGTLYVAAELYHLIGAGSAFAIMVAVTLAGLGLALRHGPPTAIMALIGGFAAPLVSGFDAANIGPLLVYLGLLVAALFGLAIRRGWVWLALAACGGGFVWANILVAAVTGDALAGAGGFVVLLAIGATLALPRTGAARPLLRVLPMVAGLIQLLVLAPALDFGPLAWGLYLVLSAAALWLGWRDETLAPGAAAALALVLGLLGTALARHELTSAPLAAIAVTVLFGSVGHLLARRGALWAAIAIGATAGPVILALGLAHGLVSAGLWAALLTLAALAAAALSWRDRDRANQALLLSIGLAGGAGAAALLFGLAEAELVSAPWRWPAWLATGAALAAWSRRSGDATIGRLALAPLVVTAAAMAIGFERLEPYLRSIALAAPMPAPTDLAAIGLLPALLVGATAWLLAPGRARIALGWIALGLGLAFIPALLPAPWHTPGLALATAALISYRRTPRHWALAAGLTTLAFAVPLLAALFALAGGSLLGNRLPWLDLPPLLTILRELTLPAGLIAAALWHGRVMPGPWRSRATAILAGIATVTVYALAKAPLAIGTPERFEALGMLERIAITQLAFAAAWGLGRYRADLGRALLILALGRFVWFDLILLNPVLVRQSVGSLPLLNLATIDAGLVAAWLWPRRHDRYWRGAMLAAVIVAVAAAVRQAMHGDVLTGEIGRTENWLYSAAFLALALAWLAHGIRTGLGDLRIAGLALLTAVTLKVFLIDAAALEGILRILSFLGLGLALIGIGWAYGRIAPASGARKG